ncbi:hypothetical protein Tcan_01438 [Toxocara canis]|uniref:Uncharacterized protein n=1 Tax=Toxocara canis TaxID=6265 RepID=A0A0B2URH6_TOXCA|nr:hypothetical protein Tcan_01438 [Toxocara canis]
MWQSLAARVFAGFVTHASMQEGNHFNDTILFNVFSDIRDDPYYGDGPNVATAHTIRTQSMGSFITLLGTVTMVYDDILIFATPATSRERAFFSHHGASSKYFCVQSDSIWLRRAEAEDVKASTLPLEESSEQESKIAIIKSISQQEVQDVWPVHKVVRVVQEYAIVKRQNPFAPRLSMASYEC